MRQDAVELSAQLAKEMKDFLDKIKLKPQCYTCTNFHSKENGEEDVCKTCNRFCNYTTK